MRRSVLVLTVLLSACVARQAPPQAQPAPVATTEPHTRRLVGLSATELVGHFGSPALQVREGSSLKLQFRTRRCVLDAYLYPGRDGGLRVTHVDTRAPSGLDTDQAACISALESAS